MGSVANQASVELWSTGRVACRLRIESSYGVCACQQDSTSS